MNLLVYKTLITSKLSKLLFDSIIFYVAMIVKTTLYSFIIIKLNVKLFRRRY